MVPMKIKNIINVLNVLLNVKLVKILDQIVQAATLQDHLNIYNYKTKIIINTPAL
jgi:hypothetical protein